MNLIFQIVIWSLKSKRKVIFKTKGEITKYKYRFHVAAFKYQKSEF